MEIVLLEDAKALGRKGQTVKINGGYARNFILSKKLGVEATLKNLNNLKLQRANADKIAVEQLAAIKELEEKLEKSSMVPFIKAEENGGVFDFMFSKETGKVTTEQLGLDTDKKKPILPESLKTFGTHEVSVKLHKDVTVKPVVKVVETQEAQHMNEALLKRVPPHSIKAGQSVIGSMLMDRGTIISASEVVIVDDFYQHQYGVTLEFMVGSFNGREPVDLIILQNCLEEKDVPPEVSSLGFVRDIITAVPAFTNVKPYANIVREKAVLRRLIRINEEIANTCCMGKDKLEDILVHTEKTIFDLLQNRTSGEFVPVRRVALNVPENIERASKNKDTVVDVPPRFISLDHRTLGFQPSDSIPVAVHPSMGKTASVLNVVDNMAVKKGLPCMAFGLEMPKKQLVNCMLSMEPDADPQKLRVEALIDSDWDTVMEGINVIGNSKSIVDDASNISVMGLRFKCQKMKSEHGLSLVTTDYLQLVSDNGKDGGNHQQEVSGTSRSSKVLARKMQAPMIALPRLSRTCEAGQGHRSMFSGPRESGAIGQNVDVVMFLCYDDCYNKGTKNKDIAEVITAKQHNGPIGTVNPAWMPQYIKFASVVRQSYE